MGALLREGSPLGPLKVMAKTVGRFFQIPIPGFRPFVVFGPEANRKVLVTERDKLLWRNTDPVTDLLRHRSGRREAAPGCFARCRRKFVNSRQLEACLSAASRDTDRDPLINVRQ